MTALRVLTILAAVLIVVGAVRFGGEAEYGPDGFRFWLRAGGLRFCLYPPSKRKKAGPKEKKSNRADAKPGKKQAKPEENKDKQEGKIKVTPDLVKNLVTLAAEGVGGFKRRIRIHWLNVSYTSSVPGNAAATAMEYGYANAVAGTVLPLIRENFDLREYHIHTDLDFNGNGSKVAASGYFSGRIGILFLLSARIGIKFLMIWFRAKKTGKPDTKTPENRGKLEKEAS